MRDLDLAETPADGPRLQPADDRSRSAMTRTSDSTIIDPIPYVWILVDCWQTIALAILTSLLLTFAITTFFMSKAYTATAIVRPVPKATLQSRVSASAVGLAGGIGMFGGLLSSAPGTDEAHEYITILQSFAFNTTLIRNHHLESEFCRLSSNRLLAYIDYQDPRWRGYKRLMRYFTSEFSTKDGNLKLSFDGRTVQEAEQILGFYLSDLREKLRTRQIQEESAAIASMKEEAKGTSDALLLGQLYELIARQTQELTLAQVQADFAFTILEPPIAPDKPSHPKRLLDCALVGFMTAMVTCVVVLVKRSPFVAQIQLSRPPRTKTHNN